MYTISNPHAKLLEMKWRDRQKDKQREKKKSHQSNTSSWLG